MKSTTRRTTLISDSREGSITLEASLVTPLFLFAMLFLIYLIQTSVTAMALHGALSQTVRQAAAEWYPISAELDSIRSSSVYQKEQEWEQKLEDAGQTLAQFGDLLPSPLSDWVMQAEDGSFSLEQAAAKKTFEVWAARYADQGVLDSSRLSIVSAGIPAEEDRNDAYLSIEAEYRLPFRIPFIGQPLSLSEAAKERAWIGGSPSTALLEKPEARQGDLTVVSIEPSPVTRGHDVTLTLKAAPGESVDLTVYYKSGESQAKHLGRATADGAGQISWTWHVSGNTTPGDWDWVAVSGSGAELRQKFKVVPASK
ncbi:hypothetical protein [Cohnella zeiphila]|uniref:Pilus assembly protein n=1 Tax=Cohnella zeiphila TaxID=2761120 RepID=A0A7X0VV47_9BACL|nr:hypothetical protein [Cohnella zeiphila]MBB6730972.1 hypothetical protein [Cohnella zeiphila]